MKRILWTAVLAAVLWGLPRLPHPAVDIGKLEPVEAVLLEIGKTGIRLETDTGAVGYGATLDEAIMDLRRSAATEVFLDSAGKLVLMGDADLYWTEILERFRPSCRVCKGEGELDLEEAARYLSVHEPALNLNGVRAGCVNWEVLRMSGGRGSLEPE